MSQGLNGVRRAASVRKQERFTALLHHLSLNLLRDSFFALKRQASPGVIGVAWQPGSLWSVPGPTIETSLYPEG